MFCRAVSSEGWNLMTAFLGKGTRWEAESRRLSKMTGPLFGHPGSYLLWKAMVRTEPDTRNGNNLLENMSRKRTETEESRVVFRTGKYAALQGLSAQG